MVCWQQVKGTLLNACIIQTVHDLVNHINSIDFYDTKKEPGEGGL
jgi:hypothetical protein